MKNINWIRIENTENYKQLFAKSFEVKLKKNCASPPIIEASI